MSHTVQHKGLLISGEVWIIQIDNIITSGPLENSHQSLKDEFAFETCFEAHSVRSKNTMMGKNVLPDVVVYVAVALATSDTGRHWPLMKNATMRVVGLDASPERGDNQ